LFGELEQQAHTMLPGVNYRSVSSRPTVRKQQGNDRTPGPDALV